MLSKLLNIHRNSVWNKLNNGKRFCVDEAIKMHKMYFPDVELEILFDQSGIVEVGNVL